MNTQTRHAFLLSAISAVVLATFNTNTTQAAESDEAPILRPTVSFAMG